MRETERERKVRREIEREGERRQPDSIAVTGPDSSKRLSRWKGVTLLAIEQARVNVHRPAGADQCQCTDLMEPIDKP
jgi:nicotinic acid mononucleotide adenylyltransferase